jgi:hypothetical protein
VKVWIAWDFKSMMTNISQEKIFLFVNDLKVALNDILLQFFFHLVASCIASPVVFNRAVAKPESISGFKFFHYFTIITSPSHA